MFFSSSFQTHSVNFSILQTANRSLTDKRSVLGHLVNTWMVGGDASCAVACAMPCVMHEDTRLPVGRDSWSQLKTWEVMI